MTKREPRNRDPQSPIKILAGDQLKKRKLRFRLAKINIEIARPASFSSIIYKLKVREIIKTFVDKSPSAPSIKLKVFKSHTQIRIRTIKKENFFRGSIS
jgi:hypothetical protein